MTDFASYALRLRSGNPDIFLGSLAWYSVSESVSITHDALKKALTTAGLSTNGVLPPKDDDVFRRVCSAAQENGKGIGTAHGTFLRVLLRDVKREKGEVHKQLVLEEVDANNEKLGFTATHKVVFANSAIHVTAIEASPYSGVSDRVLKGIEDGYAAGRNRHNAYAIRELIRKGLLSANAALVRPTGGVYFVMRTNAPQLDSVLKLGEIVDGASIHALPLIDDAKQRQMVKEAVESETVLEIDRRMAEIDKIMNGPEISPKRFESLMNEMNELVNKTESYSDLLEEALGNSENRITFYRKKMAKLLNHVKAAE